MVPESLEEAYELTQRNSSYNLKKFFLRLRHKTEFSL